MEDKVDLDDSYDNLELDVDLSWKCGCGKHPTHPTYLNEGEWKELRCPTCGAVAKVRIEIEPA